MLGADRHPRRSKPNLPPEQMLQGGGAKVQLPARCRCLPRCSAGTSGWPSCPVSPASPTTLPCPAASRPVPAEPKVSLCRHSVWVPVSPTHRRQCPFLTSTSPSWGARGCRGAPASPRCSPTGVAGAVPLPTRTEAPAGAVGLFAHRAGREIAAGAGSTCSHSSLPAYLLWDAC